MSEKHTPGPWAYSTSTEGWSYTIYIHQADNAAYTPDWSDVAFSTCKGERQEIQEANARLIAAAPELLEALEGLCGLAELRPGHLQDYKAAVASARAAIAKATGAQ